MLAAVTKHSERGSSIFIFPEGTRSEDGQIKPFKKGAFSIAQKLQLPILPVVIHGTADALPKHSLKFHGSHNINVEILKAIEPVEYEGMSVAELAEHTKGMISQRFEQYASEA